MEIKEQEAKGILKPATSSQRSQVKYPEDVRLIAGRFRIRPGNVIKEDEETIFTTEDELSGSQIEVKLAKYTISDNYGDISVFHNPLWVYENNKIVGWHYLKYCPDRKTSDDVLGKLSQVHIIGNMLEQLGPRTNTKEISDLIKYYRDNMFEFFYEETNQEHAEESDEPWILDYIPKNKKGHVIATQLLQGFHVHRNVGEEAHELRKWYPDYK